MATQLEDLADDEPEDIEVGDAIDPGDAAAGDDAPVDEEDEITFGDAGAVQGEDESPAIRNQRERIKQLEREKKELEERVAPKIDLVGEKPHIDDFWDRPDEYDAALLAWNEKRRAQDEAKAQNELRAKRQQQRWAEQSRDLDTSFADLRVVGKDAARETVEREFPGEAFAYLVKAAKGNAAGFVFALGNSADKRSELKKLAENGDWAEFITEAAIMAKEVQVTKRRPTTQPEQVHGGSSGGAAATSRAADAKLARLEAEAAQSNDYTKVFAYKRELRRT